MCVRRTELGKWQPAPPFLDVLDKRNMPMFNLRTFINHLMRKRVTYLISDTHFDHVNIIDYCHRPFNTIHQMNETIVRNWNNAVSRNDTVYFLGDWGWGRKARPSSYWKHRLNGHITSLRGSHDRGGLRHKIIKSGRHTFLLIHDPNDNHNWHGWLIHGHIHNNKMDKYPFINGHRKTINVSVELIGYRPISLDALEALNIDKIKWMRTSLSQPDYW